MYMQSAHRIWPNAHWKRSIDEHDIRHPHRTWHILCAFKSIFDPRLIWMDQCLYMSQNAAEFAAPDGCRRQNAFAFLFWIKFEMAELCKYHAKIICIVYHHSALVLNRNVVCILIIHENDPCHPRGSLICALKAHLLGDDNQRAQHSRFDIEFAIIPSLRVVNPHTSPVQPPRPSPERLFCFRFPSQHDMTDTIKWPLCVRIYTDDIQMLSNCRRLSIVAHAQVNEQCAHIFCARTQSATCGAARRYALMPTAMR